MPDVQMKFPLFHSIDLRYRPYECEESDSLRGDKGNRTPNLFHAMEARYQLRHIPVFNFILASP